jgi:hypothetical protein
MTQLSSNAETLLSLQVVRDPTNVPEDHGLQGPIRLAQFLIHEAVQVESVAKLSSNIAAGNLSISATVRGDFAPLFVAQLTVLEHRVIVSASNDQQFRGIMDFSRGETSEEPCLVLTAFMRDGNEGLGATYYRLDNELPSYQEVVANEYAVSPSPSLDALYHTAILLGNYARQVAAAPSNQLSVVARSQD